MANNNLKDAQAANVSVQMWNYWDQPRYVGVSARCSLHPPSNAATLEPPQLMCARACRPRCRPMQTIFTILLFVAWVLGMIIFFAVSCTIQWRAPAHRLDGEQVLRQGRQRRDASSLARDSATALRSGSGLWRLLCPRCSLPACLPAALAQLDRFESHVPEEDKLTPGEQVKQGWSNLKQRLHLGGFGKTAE